MAIAEAKTGSVLCELIRCPICRADLELIETAWQCQNIACGEIHAAVDGVPILLNERNSVFEAGTFLDRQPTFFKPRGACEPCSATGCRRSTGTWLLGAC